MQGYISKNNILCKFIRFNNKFAEMLGSHCYLHATKYDSYEGRLAKKM